MSDEQNISIKTVSILAETLKRVASGGISDHELAVTLQALIEKKSVDKSSMGMAVIATYERVEITEAFLAQTMVYNGQLLRRHRNGGGWVPVVQDEHDESKSFVAETVYVGPFAMVCNSARVLDNAQISANAWVSRNARVFNNALVSGYARVGGSSWVFENSQIYGNACVDECAQVSGFAQITGEAHLTGRTVVSGDIELKKGYHFR